MALTLKEIQEKLREQSARKERQTSNIGDNPVYPFWNNPENSTATARLIPDGDETNDFFWRTRLIIKIPFSGIKGQDTGNKRVEVHVPCVNMWKPFSCPITAAIAPWWKDESLIDMARTYYRKVSHLYQGFVVEDPSNDTPPENPIRRFIINDGLHEKIKSILTSKDAEYLPTDYDNGRDFYLVKNMKSQGPGKQPYPNYDNSSWALRERPLNASERAAIAQYGLPSLSSFIPKKPDDAQLKTIMEMFEASVDGNLYDPDRWAHHYKPSGFKTDEATASTATTATTHDDEPPFEPNVPVTTTPVTAKPAGKTMTPEEILAMVRNRKV